MSRREVSAGGLVTRAGKVLLVRMKNLRSELVWTFPKGHLEDRESPREAALREVQEESGWRCEIRGVLPTVRYSFLREGRKVDKKVHWYWMRPLSKRGGPDPEEIFGMKWLTFDRAEELLGYPADFRLLAAVRRRAR